LQETGCAQEEEFLDAAFAITKQAARGDLPGTIAPKVLQRAEGISTNMPTMNSISVPNRVAGRRS
jgi:hypothetical protein